MNEQWNNARTALDRNRVELLQQVEEWLEVPMIVLGFGWLALLVAELVWGISPLLEALSTVIWGIFLLDFGIRFTLAPAKRAYLRTNWLTVIALAIPALRVFRIFFVLRFLRAARAVRGLQLVRVVTSLNRGMKALRAGMGRRGLGYIVAFTTLVALTGAAAMFAFEREFGGLDSYGAALWWTAMILTTMGSDYWPQSAEGRLLTFFLSLYAFGVFGYVTAALAAFFLGREAQHSDGELLTPDSIAQLHTEISGLRAELRRLHEESPQRPSPGHRVP